MVECRSVILHLWYLLSTATRVDIGAITYLVEILKAFELNDEVGMKRSHIGWRQLSTFDN